MSEKSQFKFVDESNFANLMSFLLQNNKKLGVGAIFNNSISKVERKITRKRVISHVL